MKLVIVGGGASALMLASILKKEKANIDILILEKLEHVGKKILMSGNGKCNLSNANISPLCYNNEFAYNIANSFDAEKYFNQLGLLTYHDEQGRIYPVSNMANSVLDVLRESINGVNVKTSYCVNKISCNNTSYNINNEINADFVVMASGGKTYYKDCNSYLLSSMLSHRVSPLRPSLCSLKVKENLASIENLRCKVKASLLANGNEVYEDEGEVLFKKDALSGIVIFQLSSMICRDPYKKYSIKLDLLPSMDEEELACFIHKHPNMTGLLAKMVNQYVVKHSKSSSPKDIANTIKNLTFDVIDTIEFKNAQITSGGVNVSEVSNSLESKLHKNLYFMGEILDADGICGGYNLHFAFASAFAVAKDIIKKVGVK